MLTPHVTPCSRTEAQALLAPAAGIAPGTLLAALADVPAQLAALDGLRPRATRTVNARDVVPDPRVLDEALRAADVGAVRDAVRALDAPEDVVAVAVLDGGEVVLFTGPAV